MSAVVRATINTLLRHEDVKSDVVKAFKYANVLLGKMKSSKSTHGELSIFNVQLGLSPSAGSRRENQALPAPGFAEFKRAQVDMVNQYGRAQVSGPAMAAAEGAKGPIKSLVQRILTNAKDGLIHDRQRQMWGDGTGKLGLVQTAGAAVTSIAVTSPYGASYDTTKLTGFDKVKTYVLGMQIFVDNGTSAKVTTTVTGIDHANGTLTVSPAVTVDAGAAIYRGESASDLNQTNKDYELQGIGRVFGTSGDYLGIARSGYRQWQAAEIALADGKLSLPAMRAARNETLKFGVADQDLAICDPTVKGLYEQLLDGRNRAVNVKTLSGGFKALDYDGIDLVADKDALPQRLFFLRTSDFTRYFHKDLGWIGEDEGQVLKQIQGYDLYDCALRVYDNVACEAPCNQVVLTNITGV